MIGRSWCLPGSSLARDAWVPGCEGLKTPGYMGWAAIGRESARGLGDRMVAPTRCVADRPDSSGRLGRRARRPGACELPHPRPLSPPRERGGVLPGAGVCQAEAWPAEMAAGV